MNFKLLDELMDARLTKSAAKWTPTPLPEVPAVSPNLSGAPSKAQADYARQEGQRVQQNIMGNAEQSAQRGGFIGPIINKWITAPMAGAGRQMHVGWDQGFGNIGARLRNAFGIAQSQVPNASIAPTPMTVPAPELKRMAKKPIPVATPAAAAGAAAGVVNPITSYWQQQIGSKAKEPVLPVDRTQQPEYKVKGSIPTGKLPNVPTSNRGSGQTYYTPTPPETEADYVMSEKHNSASDLLERVTAHFTPDTLSKRAWNPFNRRQGIGDIPNIGSYIDRAAGQSGFKPTGDAGAKAVTQWENSNPAQAALARQGDPKPAPVAKPVTQSAPIAKPTAQPAAPAAPAAAPGPDLRGVGGVGLNTPGQKALWAGGGNYAQGKSSIRYDFGGQTTNFPGRAEYRANNPIAKPVTPPPAQAPTRAPAAPSTAPGNSPQNPTASQMNVGRGLFTPGTTMMPAAPVGPRTTAPFAGSATAPGSQLSVLPRLTPPPNLSPATYSGGLLRAGVRQNPAVPAKMGADQTLSGDIAAAGTGGIAGSLGGSYLAARFSPNAVNADGEAALKLPPDSLKAALRKLRTAGKYALPAGIATAALAVLLKHKYGVSE